MMDFEYQSLRTFADSWGLLFMLLVFLFVLFRAFRPSARSQHQDAANIPFKED
jgi:cytochrome c oxidase cbb3-type subunit IV